MHPLLPGTGLSAATGNTALPSPSAPPFNYAEALHKALLFYEEMKSGTLDRQRLAWCGLTARPIADRLGPPVLHSKVLVLIRMARSYLP